MQHTVYIGPSNLSKSSLLEQLLYISNETATVISELYKKAKLDSGLPDTVVLDKFLRQDIAMAKERVDSAVEKMLYYIASSRMDLIDHKEFFINIAQRYKTMLSMLETAVHRLLLLSKKIEETDNQILDKFRKLFKLSEETTFIINTTMRKLISINTGATRVLKSIEDDIVKIRMNEKLADEIYRELIERILDKYGNNPIALLLYKEILDSIENILDTAFEQGSDILILARSFAG